MASTSWPIRNALKVGLVSQIFLTCLTLQCLEQQNGERTWGLSKKNLGSSSGCLLTFEPGISSLRPHSCSCKVKLNQMFSVVPSNFNIL